jgi:ribose transport system substrate-binding protein
MRSLATRAALAVALATIFAISTEPADAKERIYYLIPTLIDEFQTESQRMIEGIFQSLDYEIISVDARGDPDLQAQQFKNAAADRPSAIILNAVDSDSIGRTLAQYKTNDIPVLVYDRMLPMEDKFDFASVSDAESIGKLGAEMVIKLLNASASPGDKKTVLQIVGDPGDSYSLRVLRGFRTKFKDFKSFEVITIPAMAWEPANARKVANELVQAKRHIDFIFCHSADLAGAVIPLFEGKIEKGEIQVAAITGAPAGLVNLTRGLQKFEIEQPLYAQVYGLALGLQQIKSRKAGDTGSLTDGRCDLLGAPGKLSAQGRLLEFEGKPITLADFKNRASLELWGDLARPVKSAAEIRGLTCEGR